MRIAPLSIALLVVACSSDAERDAPLDAATAADAAGRDTLEAVDSTSPDTTTADDATTTDDAKDDASTKDDAVGDSAKAPLVPALVTCAPAPPTCPRGAADATIRASYRKDSYLPSYAEDGDAPTSGGRFHITGVSAVSGAITKVTIDGVDVLALSTASKPSIEWAHVWPRNVVAGEPLYVQLHSRDAKWDTAMSGKVRVETDAGVALDGAFPVARTTVPITWVTTSSDRKTLLVHLHNRDAAPRTIKRVLLDGRDVTAEACIADKKIASTALLTIPLCEPSRDGAPWTLAVEYDDAVTAVAAGRALRPFYPVEAWNNTGECPWPGGSSTNHDAIVVKGGVDTLYTHGGVCAKCGCDSYKLMNETLPAASIRTLVTDDLATSLKKLTNLDGVAAFATGDESDGAVFEGTVSVPAKKAEKSAQLWQLYPELPTFNGGKTNKNIGTFAGMADVQGMDFYIGACAPHITRFGTDYPLRGAYDYLRNTRENHMPLATWLYAQGLSPAWHKEVTVGGVKLVDYYADPSPNEIWVQAFQVYAAGAKGFLWFQVNQDRAKAAPATWAAIVAVNKITRAVRELLREGDLTAGAKTSGKALVEAIRARDAIVVPVINEDATNRPTDTACNTAASASAVPHWKFAAQKLSVDVAVPPDLAIDDVFEVTAEGPQSFATFAVSGRTLTLKDVAVDDARPARLFVLARDKSLRASLPK